MRAPRRPRRGRPTDRCRTHVFHCRFHRGTVPTQDHGADRFQRTSRDGARSIRGGAVTRRAGSDARADPRLRPGRRREVFRPSRTGRRRGGRPCGAFPFAPEPAVPPRPGPVDRARAADSGAASRTNLTRKAVGRRIRARRQMSICGAARRQGPAAFRGRAYGCPGIRRASPTRTRTRSTLCGRGKL